MYGKAETAANDMLEVFGFVLEGFSQEQITRAFNRYLAEGLIFPVPAQIKGLVQDEIKAGKYKKHDNEAIERAKRMYAAAMQDGEPGTGTAENAIVQHIRRNFPGIG